MPLETIETLPLTPSLFETLKLQIVAVEQERYGDADVLSGRRAACRPPAAAAVPARNAGSDDGAIPARSASPCAIASRDGSSATGWAARSRTTTRKGSPPTRTPATTTRSFCRRWRRCRPCRTPPRSRTCCSTRCGSARSPKDSPILSTLIEERLLTTGPAWLKAATVLERIDNYLRSGITFVYLQAPLTAPTAVSERRALEQF